MSPWFHVWHMMSGSTGRDPNHGSYGPFSRRGFVFAADPRSRPGHRGDAPGAGCGGVSAGVWKGQASAACDPASTHSSTLFTAFFTVSAAFWAACLAFPTAWSVLPSARSLSFPVSVPTASLTRPFTTSVLPPMMATPFHRGCWLMSRNRLWLRTLATRRGRLYPARPKPTVPPFGYPSRPRRWSHGPRPA